MIYSLTAADVAAYAVKRAIEYEKKQDLRQAEAEFCHAIAKAICAAEDPENQKCNIVFDTYFQYGAYLYRNRRFLDAHKALEAAKRALVESSDASDETEQEISRMDAEIHRIVRACFRV